jgi:general nucleoside transport system permease protein
MKAFSFRRIFQALLIPVLAVFTALVVGAFLMLIFGDNPLQAYAGLFNGAFGAPKDWAETIRRMTPLILTGLSVAVAFKAGLFNIGASGQFIIGTVCSVAVGVNFEGLPTVVHLPLAILAGIAGGMAWGAIPGLLKVFTGAHEVIVTIMLNYIASLFAGWTVYAGGTQGQTPGPLWDPTARAISETPDVFLSAQIPWIFGPPYRIHFGVALALLAAMFIYWLIFRTTFGFEVRTVGENEKAARYAGVNVRWVIVMTMMISGGLAGLAGAIETLGLNHKFAPEFTGAAGFDGITVALLGQAHPFGVILSAFLMGALDAGASQMQFDSGVSQDIVQVIQGLVLAFVAAPLIIRQIYRIRRPTNQVDTTVLSGGWGK